MKKTVCSLAIGMVTFLAANVFAGTWDISCDDKKEARMHFSATSFSGLPLLSFISSSRHISLIGAAIKMEPQEQGGMLVTGTQREGRSVSVVQFPVPDLENEGGVIKELKYFRTNVMVYSQNEKDATKQVFSMQCIARDVVYS